MLQEGQSQTQSLRKQKAGGARVRRALHARTGSYSRSPLPLSPGSAAAQTADKTLGRHNSLCALQGGVKADAAVGNRGSMLAQGPKGITN